MTSFVIKSVAIFAAACSGIAFDVEACPTKMAPTTDHGDAQIIRFAIAGLVDIDNDGKSDLALVRRVIKQAGGAIDAELRIDGQLTGKLRRETAYLVVGKLPDETTVSPMVANQFRAFMRRASELNIRMIQLNELLVMGRRQTPSVLDGGSVFRQRRPRSRQSAY